MLSSSSAGYTLSELYRNVGEEDESSLSQQKLLEKLQAQASLLASPENQLREHDDLKSAEKLSSWVSKAILPDKNSVSYDELPEVEPSQERHAAIALSQQKATLGLKTLSYLQNLQNTPQASIPHPPTPVPDPQMLLSLVAFSSTRDPWTTSETLSTAKTLLAQHFDYLHSTEFIVTHLLQGFIRPLFSKSKPSAITSTGRKAMPTSAPPRRHQIGDLDRASKPWKYEVVYAVTVFEWAVENVSDEILSQSWNVFIPPLITLLDNTTSTVLLCRALTTLTLFLPKFGTKLLIQTGLGDVFEDAVSPILHFIPSITPVQESIQLLPRAYEALFVLCDVRFPSTDGKAPQGKAQAQAQAQEKDKDRIAFLDRIVRGGIASGYLHAADHPAIVEILLTQLAILVRKLGIHSVKHLKDTIPIISAVLVDPFSASRPSLLLAGVRALRETVLNGWPRMRDDAVHRMEVVKAVVLCWRNIDDEGDFEGKAGIREELKIVGRVLVKAVDGGVDVTSELGPLVEADSGLGELFGLEDGGKS